MRLGIFGAGQLAQMMAVAAKRLGIDVVCIGKADECASVVCQVVEVNMSQPEEIQRFLSTVDVATFESENIDISHLQGDHIYPLVNSVAIGQDRLKEKNYFNAMGMATAPFAVVNTLQELQQALSKITPPAILKTTRGGYDGKGQYVIKNAHDIEQAWHDLAHKGELIVEGFVDFACEVSLVGVRSRSGDTQFYPLAHNIHQKGILHMSHIPVSGVERTRLEKLQYKAEQYMRTIMEDLDYVGVLAIEFFVVNNEQGEPTELIANEMAPRVHNSGHWSIDGSITSQFENHIRAIFDLPLGAVDYQPTTMINAIGAMPNMKHCLKIPTLKYHNYHKTARKGRKMGHVNIVKTDGYNAQHITQALKLVQNSPDI